MRQGVMTQTLVSWLFSAAQFSRILHVHCHSLSCIHPEPIKRNVFFFFKKIFAIGKDGLSVVMESIIKLYKITIITIMAIRWKI